MAMYSAAILADENRKLRAANERQKKNKAIRRSYIATRGVLTVQEGLDRSIVTDTEVTGQSTGGVTEQRTCALRMCSICRSLKHTARTCPDRVNLS